MELPFNFEDGIIGANLAATGGSQAITGLFKSIPPFPTLVAPQFIKLIFDFDEIAYLTNYTAGSLNGTILRAQEGTAASAHVANSSTWYNSATVQNYGYNDEPRLSQYGVAGNLGTDFGATINGILADLSANNAACTAVLPPGTILGSVPFVVPEYVSLRGPGWNASSLRVTTDSDVVQMFQGNGTTANAFFCTLSNMTLHGVTSNATALTPGNWNNGLTITTNPLNTQASGDPDFDVKHDFHRLFIKLTSGEGFKHQGRSGIMLSECYVESCGGVAYWPSYDTAFSLCEASGCGTGGWYISHSDVKLVGCNSFNNGVWTIFAASTAYTLSQVVYSAGSIYACKLAYTSTGTPTLPATDTTHWVVIRTAPEYGTAFYLDGVSRVEMAGCGADGNSGSGIYLHSSTNNNIQVRISNVNFNNNQGTPAAFPTNPSNYSALVLDGSNNNIINLTTAAMATGYVLKIINGSTGNIINITTDGTEAAILSPDTTTLAGNYIIVNGTAWHAPDHVLTVAQTTTTHTIPLGYQQVQYNLNHLHTTLAVTLPAPEAGKSLFLQFTQDGTGGVTWSLPGSVLWVGGIVATPTTAAGSIDGVALNCTDGSNWIVTPALAFAT